MFELLLGSGSRTAGPSVAPFLERTLLEHPWADPELPSLVHVEGDGRVTGFVGRQARRMRFDGEPIRMACVSHLMSDPDRRRPIGAALLRRVLDGPQELSVTDTAIQPVRAMWERLGGQTVEVSESEWRRPLRPWALAVRRLSRRPGRAVAALDSATAAVLPGRFGARHPPGSLEQLTPETLLRHLGPVTEGLRLAPAWDRPFLDWLFAELDGKELGRLSAWAVTDSDGPVGWFLYHLDPGATSHVVEVAARPGRHGEVLDQLYRQARAEGAAGLRGRVERPLLEALRAGRCRFRPAGGSMLVHARDPEIVGAVQSGRALLTRLEGEWVGAT